MELNRDGLSSHIQSRTYCKWCRASTDLTRDGSVNTLNCKWQSHSFVIRLISQWRSLEHKTLQEEYLFDTRKCWRNLPVLDYLRRSLCCCNSDDQPKHTLRKSLHLRYRCDKECANFLGFFCQLNSNCDLPHWFCIYCQKPKWKCLRHKSFHVGRNRTDFLDTNKQLQLLHKQPLPSHCVCSVCRRLLKRGIPRL